MTQFGDVYSQYYDLLYSDKDYIKETDYIEALLRKYDKEVASVLEFGCGTGRYAELLVEKGFSVHGVDLSREMLKKAEMRRFGKEDKLIFTQGNIHEMNLGKEYDAVVSLFHVMSYQNTNQDVKKTLESVKQHLKDGGLFIFDFWYGPGVLTNLPAIRIKRFENNAVKITRLAEPIIHAKNNVVEVNYEIFIENKLTGFVGKEHEKHRMRYFFDTELELFSELTGFKLIDRFAWLSDKEPILDTWNAIWLLKKEY